MSQYQTTLRHFAVAGFENAFMANQRLYSHCASIVQTLLILAIGANAVMAVGLFAAHQANLSEAFIAFILGSIMSLFVGGFLSLMGFSPLQRLARKWVPSFRRDVMMFKNNAQQVLKNHLSQTEWQHAIASEIEKTLDMNLGIEYNTQVRQDLKEFKIACSSEQYESALHRLLNIYALFTSMENVFHRRDMVRQFDKGSKSEEIHVSMDEQELSIGQNI